MIYAEIKDSNVTNIFYIEDISILSLFDETLIYDDVTNIRPSPGIGWSYISAGVYTSPIILASVAIQKNISQFQTALQAFISAHYTTDTRLNFIGLYENAILNGLIARQAYIAQIFVWQNSIIAYAATYIAAIKAMTDSSLIASTVWDFTALAASDPLLSPMAAIQINS